MSERPAGRYDISTLEQHSTTDRARVQALGGVMFQKGFKGRFLTGETCGLNWIATQDHDGQIEVSLSAATRPLNFQVLRLFALFKMKPVAEESKSVGKIRHFVVQKGAL
jgi:hypothetical protein